MSFLGNVVDKTEAGFITKVLPRTKRDTTSYFVFLGVQPADLKKPAGMPASTLAAARDILGHRIEHPVKLTVPKSQIKGPAKGR